MYRECPNPKMERVEIGNTSTLLPQPCNNTDCEVCNANFAEEQASEIAAENAAGVNDGYAFIVRRRFWED